MGVVFVSQAVEPAMKERQSGKIINIASIAARQGGAGIPHYNASKAAVVSWTQSHALQLAPYQVNVNAICPGGTDTEGFRAAFNTKGRSENPILMDPQEIAQVALFLASDASSAITGTAIDSFGGSNPIFS